MVPGGNFAPALTAMLANTATPEPRAVFSSSVTPGPVRAPVQRMLPFTVLSRPTDDPSSTERRTTEPELIFDPCSKTA